MSEKSRRLNTRIAVMLAGMRLIHKEFYNLNISPDANRRIVERDSRLVAGRSEKIYRVIDTGVHDGLPVRIYRPSDRAGLPLILYIHGGGWVVGSIATHDNVCRKLANRSGAIVVSVGYRLAPENKFPAGLEDVYAALQWAHTEAASFGGDPCRLAVAGDSAGGNLAAAVCLVTRDRGGPPIRFQALAYPALDASNQDRKSYRLNEKGYYLTTKIIEQVIPLYINKSGDVFDPYVSPLLAGDVTGLPPALVITAQFDPLMSEGEAYAARLFDAGIPCRLHRYNGMIHGFLSFTGLLPQAGQAIGEMAAALSEALQ
ncbi:MAG: alpha/beta hydrolase [Dehalococcoidia bacterium]|nr:alpha/beta hydrolase [Dehalococcoidia bacterium]